jgi:hypothetical protein
MIKPGDEQLSQSIVARLAHLLATTNSEHSNYQALPDFVLDQIRRHMTIEYSQDQVNLDQSRYDWLCRHLDCTDMTVTEIGANLGYFCLRLAQDYAAQACMYEPIAAYAEAVDLMAGLTGLGDRVVAHGRPVALPEIADLSRSDLLICLNVLHHAGRTFAKAEVENVAAWRAYALRYLAALRQRGDWLLFQIGNLLDGEPLCDGDQVLPFTRDLLQESGWSIVAVGVVSDFEKLSYDSYAVDELHGAPIIHCRRNMSTDLVDYFLGDQCVAEMITGLAQRPIWLCKKSNS